MSVQYTLYPSNPAAHIFTVSIYIENPNPEGQRFSLPTWIPGSYMIREFSKNIVEIHAKTGDVSIPVRQLNKNTWVVHTDGQPCIVEYDVYAWDLSVRMAHLDQTHGYCNGTSVFLQVEGMEEQIHRVLIQEPSDPLCSDWRIATTLKSLGEDPYAFGWFEASDYDDLIDHPIEMGTFELLKFEACGIPHEIALTGKARFCRERLVADLKTICEYELNFFGAPAPMDRYLFQILIESSGYGGLEHRSSTSLICERENLPEDMTTTTNEYVQFLGLVSHEYFHTWHVKRLKPAVFMPYDLSVESYTSLLWVFEGWTSYYDDLILLRAGLINEEQYRWLVGRMITRVYKGSGLYKQSLTDSSFTAWTKFYRQDENAPNSVVSYYAKGAMAAMALDLYLRQKTDNATTLDDVLLTLWRDFGAQGIGLQEDTVEKVASQVSGLDLTDFFDQVVRGTGKIGLDPLFAEVGVKALNRHPVSYTDAGGKLSSRPSIQHLGCAFKSGQGTKIRIVYDGGAAQKAGLSAGDDLIAIDGIQVKPGRVHSMLERYQFGESVHVHFFRRGVLMERDLVFETAPFKVYYLQFMNDDLELIERRNQWLYAR